MVTFGFASEDEGLTSDDDPQQAPKSGPQWLTFEKDVAAFLEKLGDSLVVHDQLVDGTVSKTQRQVDVYCTGEIAGTEVTIAVECKRYVRPLGIGGVDQFIGMLLDIGAEKGILYAYSGYTAPAKARAENASSPRVELRNLENLVAWSDDLHELADDDPCQQPECWGSLTWYELDTDASAMKGKKKKLTVEVGRCGSCGQPDLNCPRCGECMWDFDNRHGTCDDCELDVQLYEDKKGTDFVGAIITPLK